MNKNHDQMVVITRYILKQFKTMSVQQIAEDAKINHPEYNLTASRIGNLLRIFRKKLQKTIETCRKNGQHQRAAQLLRRMHEQVPDKRKKLIAAVDTVLEEDVFASLIDEDIDQIH